MLRSISLVGLVSLLYLATHLNGIETSTHSSISHKILFVSSQPKKGKIFKKYHYQGGLQLILEKRFEEALSFLKPISHEEPDFKRTGYLISYAYQKLENTEKAITAYEIYLKNDKHDYQAVFNLAYVYMKTNQCPKSIEAFNKNWTKNRTILKSTFICQLAITS